MKRFLALLVILVLLVSVSGAESFGVQLALYNAAAATAGAPKLDGSLAIEKDGMFLFNMDHMMVVFETTSLGIKNIGVYANDEDGIADFLCTCLAIVWFWGNIDIEAAGMLLSQFSAIRAGRESVPYSIGDDVFNIIKNSGDGLYSFVYMNNDMQRR